MARNGRSALTGVAHPRNVLDKPGVFFTIIRIVDLAPLPQYVQDVDARAGRSGLAAKESLHVVTASPPTP